MAYFLKKSKLKKGIYLQIYESFYDPQRGHTAHKSYKALGYVNDLIQNGIDDPIAFYKQEIFELNKKTPLYNFLKNKITHKTLSHV